MFPHEATTIAAALESRGYRVEIWQTFTNDERTLAAWRPGLPHTGNAHVFLGTLDHARQYLREHCQRCDMRLTPKTIAAGRLICETCGAGQSQYPLPLGDSTHA